jgi:DNA-binding NarL/FixJ family response regulator
VGDIGAKLSLSSKTIANYVTQIKAKLGVATSAEIARLAIRSGFLKP